MNTRLTDDLTRLVGEIRAARDHRGRLMRDLARGAVEMRRAVAQLRSSFAADLAGARAAWLGAAAPVSPRAWVSEPAAPRERGVGAEREEGLREEAAEERRRLEAERRARDEAEMARKAGRRPPRRRDHRRRATP